MDFSFVIPRNREQLWEADGNKYCVRRVYTLHEIAQPMKEARMALKNLGSSLYIFEHFNTFFSLLEINPNELQLSLAIRATDLLYDSIECLIKELDQQLNSDELSDRTRTQLRNATQMLLYLMINLVKAIDVAGSSGADKQKKQKNSDFDLHNWDKKRNECVVQIYSVTQLPLEQLFDPPVVEEDLVNLVCDLSYNTLESSHVRERSNATVAFQIIGTAIKRYNHSLVFPVRIIRILSDFEPSITPIAQGIYNVLYTEFKITTILDVLMEELKGQMLECATDNKLTKHYSQFLVDLNTIAPKEMVPHLSNLSEDLLNAESYTLRNSLLQMMGEAVVSQLTGEDLEDELKEIRDEFLDDLFNHIHDIAAHVRAKVLQVWNSMKGCDAIPLARLHAVLERAVERLEDKSSLVRKAAVALIRSFLDYNPFAARLSLEEIEKQYEEEEKKLDELRQKRAEVIPIIDELHRRWESMETDLMTVIINNVTQPIEPNRNGEVLKQIGPIVGELIDQENYLEALQKVRRSDTANEEAVSNMTFEQKCQYYLVLLKSYFIMYKQPNDFQTELEKAEDTVKFLHDSLTFSRIITNATPKLKEMLMSKTNSDVFESIDFFTVAYLFSIKGCEEGVQHMIYLVWSPDKEKREAVVNAYKKILFTTDLKDPRAHAAKVVENLSRFIEKLTQGQKLAFEVLVTEWVKEEAIDHHMVQVMFERYSMKLPGTSENDSRLALQLLVLTAGSNSSIAKTNLDFLVKYGLEDKGGEDPRVFIATLELFTRATDQKYESVSKYFTKYETDSPVINAFVNGFTRLFFCRSSFDFDQVVRLGFDFIYRCCVAPDVKAQEIVWNLYQRMKDISTRLAERHEPQTPAPPDASQSQDSQTLRDGPKLNLPVLILARFIHTVGYIAMKEMIYLDIDVYNNIRWREELKDQLKQNKKAKNKAARKSQLNATLNATSVDQSASTAIKRMSVMPNNDQDDDDVVGASAEDAIAEQINYITETEMVYTKGCILEKFHPLLIDVVRHVQKFKNDELQQAAITALIHLMSVSSKFCDENMQLLMNVFQSSKNIQIKCNIVIGMSDLTFRFPNIIEPWTTHIYTTLHEDNITLRLTAVKMLSHLILHEMIRVKGQISDLAMCLVDKVPEIRIMTEQFFKEISQKSNILYNVLPDIISRLSDATSKVEEGKYQNIMRYIMALIHKEKQVESLVEKLCLRFKITNAERQWRDIGFCLTLLQYNEKTMKKLIDHVPDFKDKVQVNEIYDAFKTIINNTNKNAKPELKAVVQEFETKLEECLAVNDGGIVQSPDKDRQSTAGPSKKKTNASAKKSQPTKGRVARRGGRRAAQQSSSDSESDEEPPPTRKAARERAAEKNRTRRPAASSSSEESDCENQPPRSRRAAPTPRQHSRSKVIEDSEDSDSFEQQRPASKRTRGPKR